VLAQAAARHQHDYLLLANLVSKHSPGQARERAEAEPTSPPRGGDETTGGRQAAAA
jgi:hypothetical protein